MSDLDEALEKSIYPLNANVLATCLVVKYCIIHSVKG